MHLCNLSMQDIKQQWSLTRGHNLTNSLRLASENPRNLLARCSHIDTLRLIAYVCLVWTFALPCNDQLVACCCLKCAHSALALQKQHSKQQFEALLPLNTESFETTNSTCWPFSFPTTWLSIMQVLSSYQRSPRAQFTNLATRACLGDIRCWSWSYAIFASVICTDVHLVSWPA